ncbi:MAG: hypothetical protein HQL95_07330 [Magnetococcales bacterium]|nr:hypothetical protein [Magnetococcales bacterium]
MNDKPLGQASDEDLRQVEQALERAARRAREIAFQTHTALVVVRDGRLVREYPVQSSMPGDLR